MRDAPLFQRLPLRAALKGTSLPCGKEPHHTRGAAEAHLRQLRQRNGAYDTRALDIYVCKRCTLRDPRGRTVFHVGNLPGGRPAPEEA